MKKHCLRVNHELLPLALGIFVLACTRLLLMAKSWESSTERMESPEFRTAQPKSDVQMSILDLQPFRQASSIKIKSNTGNQGTATLVNLNPAVNSWYLLEVDWQGGSKSSYHLKTLSRVLKNCFWTPNILRELKSRKETPAIPALSLKTKQMTRWTRRGIRTRPMPHCVMDGCF